MGSIRRPAAEDHVVAVLAPGGEADVPPLLQALVALESVVPAARPLQDVSADRRHVADLGRGCLAAGLREGPVGRFHDRVARDLRQGHESPYPQGAVRGDRDLVEAWDRLQVHEAGRLEKVLLQVVEEVDSAGLQQAPRPIGRKPPRVGNARGPDELEAIHAGALLDARAARTTSGVMGRVRMRAPVALNTALAMTARVGTMHGSPIPAADVLLPPLAISVRID